MVTCKKNLKTNSSQSLLLQILSEWFGRTIICSCTKLSYEHAQSMIESPTKTIPEQELPPISPEHTSEEVHQAVLHLHRIAKELRRQRFLDGALRLDQVSHFLFFSATNRFTLCLNPTCLQLSMIVLDSSFLVSSVTALKQLPLLLAPQAPEALHCEPRQRVVSG